MAELNDIGITRSEAFNTAGPLISPKSADYVAEALQFAETSINNMKDGESLAIEYCQDQRKSRIDLYKGFHRVKTETETTTNISSLSGWKLSVAGLLVVIPWIYGVKLGFDFASNYFAGANK